MAKMAMGKTNVKQPTGKDAGKGYSNKATAGKMKKIAAADKRRAKTKTSWGKGVM